MSIADNIKRLRTAENLSQAELGKIAGVTDKAVSTWEAGLKIPRMGAIEKLAAHFGVPKSAILDDVPTNAATIPAGFEPLPEMTTIPLVGSIACGTPITAEENIEARIGIPAAWHRAIRTATSSASAASPKSRTARLLPSGSEKKLPSSASTRKVIPSRWFLSTRPIRRLSTAVQNCPTSKSKDAW